MAHFTEADGTVATLAVHRLAQALVARCETLVSPTIQGPGERERQAGLLGALVGAALAAVLSSPMLWLAGATVQLAAAPTILAGICLGLAGSLAATGRLDVIAMISAAALGAAGGLLALGTGGLFSLALWVVAIAPAEAMLAGRRNLAAFGAGIASLTIGAVALGHWAALPHPLADQAPAIDIVAAAFALLYAARLGHRLARTRRSSRLRREHAGAETALVEAALGAAVMRFAADGSPISASRLAGTLFPGVQTFSATGIARLIHVTDRVRYLQAFAELRGGTARIVVDVRMADGAGGGPTFVDTRFDLQAVRDPSGRLASIIAVARPLDPAPPAPCELERALSREQENSRAKSRFLAAMSHELRTPLNAIIGFSDVLDQEFFGAFTNPRQKEYVGLIRQSGDHLLGVVNSLLDVSKIEAGRHEIMPEALRVEHLFGAARDTMRPQIEGKGLAFALEIDPAATGVVADRRACHQILLNLLANAAKFTETGGVTLSARRAGDMLEIAVRDTGIGIAARDLPRLGQPFTQLSSGTARQYPGTGLGLSLVKGLAELHGGRMAIESEPGTGTIVRVFLPLDGSGRIDPHPPQTETVVALAHARKKPHDRPQDDRTRRSA